MDTRGEKYTRTQLDNPYQRNTAPDSFKNRQFNGYRVATDQYTGKKIFYSSSGVKGKSDSRHYTTQTTSNVDHIMPIDVFNKKYANQLSAEDARRIINSDYNLALTNEALNKAKNSSTNCQYLKEQLHKGTPEDPITTINMVSAQIKADAHIKLDVEAAKIQRAVETSAAHMSKESLVAAQQITAESAHAGASAALISLTVSGLNNLAEVATGQKDLEQALHDVGADTANTAISATGFEATQQIITEIARRANAKQLSAITQQQLPSAEIAMAAMIADSVFRYLDGELSGEDCVIEILLNGVGTYAYQLGALLGGPAGAIIVSVVATQISHAILEYQQTQKVHAERVSEIDHALDCALNEIKHQKAVLQEYAQTDSRNWDKKVERGLETIMNAIANKDVADITHGLIDITDFFHAQVLYPSVDDFDRDFYNLDVAPLVL